MSYPPPDFPPKPIPASCQLPVQALADPAKAVSRYLDQPVELIQIAKVETLDPDTVKISFFLRRA